MKISSLKQHDDTTCTAILRDNAVSINVNNQYSLPTNIQGHHRTKHK